MSYFCRHDFFLSLIQFAFKVIKIQKLFIKSVYRWLGRVIIFLLFSSVNSTFYTCSLHLSSAHLQVIRTLVMVIFAHVLYTCPVCFYRWLERSNPESYSRDWVGRAPETYWLLLASNLWLSKQLEVCVFEDSSCGSILHLVRLVEITGHSVPWFIGTLYCLLHSETIPLKLH